MKTLITATLINKTVSGMVGGILFKKDFPSVEAANDFYSLMLQAEADPTEERIDEIKAILSKGYRVAKENGLEYNLDTGEVFFQDFNTPLPALLVDVIEDYHEKGFPMESIKNFWSLLMANPDKRVREELFKFIVENGFAITKHGYLVTYKTLEWFESPVKNLQTFVTESAFFVRKNWKCSPKKYVVYKDKDADTYRITKVKTFSKWDVDEKNVELVGNLKDLEEKEYEEEEVAFIPKYVTWNKTKFDFEKEKVVLGVPKSIERSVTDADPSRECSYGLHVGSRKYVKSFASSNTSPVLVCFVNPMNVIAVPNYDNSKMRVCEYFPYAMAQRDENGEIIGVDESYFEHDYMSYEKEELEELVEKIKQEENPFSTAKNADEDERNLNEIMKIINQRVVELSNVV